MKRTISAGALALVLSGTLAVGDSAAIAQQQDIPDAPRPHATLPTVPSVGPVQSAPNAPTPAPAADTTPKPAVAPAPDAVTPAPGEGIEAGLKLYQLPTVRVNLVEVPFTVKDSKGNLISGLTDHDVRILENNVDQRIRIFHTDPYPLSVAIIVDQSMTFNDMDKVNAALTALRGSFAPYDEVSYFTYNNGPKMVTDFTGSQSDRLQMAVEASKTSGREGLMPYTSGPLANNIYKNGGTEANWDPNVNSTHGAHSSNNLNVPKEVHTLNDAIMMAAHDLTRVGRGRRRIIYVISDGKEYGSKAKTKDVVTYLQSHEITLYATLVHDIPNLHIPFSGFVMRQHLPFQMRDNILPQYANATGGQVEPELTSHGIIDSLQHLAETARTQYTIFYSSSDTSRLDGKFRSIDVRILGRPGLTVIAKPGYYPTADNAPATAAPTPPASSTTR